jgi:spermidine synthase
LSRQILLAALSGAPALVYEIVWTRQAALLAGGQIEAISGVLVAFFGGLALGARWIGPRADTAVQPLRLYAGLEASAAALAIVSSFLLRALGAGPLAGAGAALALGLCCALLLPVAILLGGTLPALLRDATRDPRAVGRIAGWLAGANTLGAVAGVAAAALCIPQLGLRATLLGAGLCALAVAALALGLARSGRQASQARPEPVGPRRPAPSGRRNPSMGVLAAAALVGVATLGYEVLATRGAMLRLGSGLYAWALVLGLFLGGLAIGNLGFARWAGRARHPETVFGFIEAGAALAVALGVGWLLPALAVPASGLRPIPLLCVALAVLPAALLMGGAFPFLVRLGRPAEGRVAGSFARVSAANTAGGVAGALVAPFLLLPTLGLTNAVLTCATLNAAVAVGFLVRGAPDLGRAGLRVGVALGALAALAGVLQSARLPSSGAHILSVAHGRQATAVVLHLGSYRMLVVDGEPEAATGGDARVTEELLAVLPLLLHPRPQRLLEVGLGSGISLGAAARFPLQQIHCVEIAPSVLRSARFFTPDNGDVASGRDPRVRVVHADGRAYLARHRAAYDVVVANTLHPWSVGATGLYSREYFERIARALRPGGVAVQWVALEPIGEQTLAAILRTILQVFPQGSIWWASDNLLVVGRAEGASDELATLRDRSRDPAVAAALRGLQLRDANAVVGRRLASFAAAREALGPGVVLEDDRPVLELLASRRAADPGAALALVARLAEAGAREDPSIGPLLLWLESRAARARGDTALADRREALAEHAGLALARSGRILREVQAARADLEAGRRAAAEAGFRRILGQAPDDSDARFGLAEVAYESGDFETSEASLRRLVADHPSHSAAWNLLGTVRERLRDPGGARAAFAAALLADPYHPYALTHAGLNALAVGDVEDALAMLERLREISPLGPSAEERTLRRAIAAAVPAALANSSSKFDSNRDVPPHSTEPAGERSRGESKN